MVKEYWDEIYSMNPRCKPDRWLDKYKFLLKDCTTVLDLGCGNGTNEDFLKKIGVFPKVCDISPKAIKIMNELHPECEASVVDISKKLPYQDSQINLIIADLSLHYFDSNTTAKIVEELKRVLNYNGIIIGRVNAIRGVKREKKFPEIEKNYYDEKECFRRYFSREDIGHFFRGFNVIVNRETITSKYGYKKYVIEFLLQKDIE